MKEFYNSLIQEVEAQMEVLNLEGLSTIEFAEAAITVYSAALQQLRKYFCNLKLKSKDEEIHFFKYLKPSLASRLIYYNHIYNLETSKPLGSNKALRKYFNSEMHKIMLFFNDNIDFCRYYRKASTHLDHKYFLRGQQDIRLALDSSYFQSDQKFATSHDYTLARIMADDLLCEYLETEIKKNTAIKTSDTSRHNSSALRWTAPKVALVELIYALHTEGTFNNGNVKLSEVANFFESAFGIDLGHFTRVFLEIRGRKNERTKFLTTLRDKLELRMEDSDNL